MPLSPEAAQLHDIAVEDFAEALAARDRGDIQHARHLAIMALLAITTADDLFEGTRGARQVTHAG